MKTKVFSGILAAIVVVAIFMFNSFALWGVIFAVAMLLAHKEAANLFKSETNYPAVVLAIVLTFFTQDAIKSMLVALIFAAGWIAYKKENGKDLLALAYANLGISCIFQIYLLGDQLALAWLVLTVVMCDSFAYFIGKKFGKNQLCEASPNKTIEGAVGGVLLAWAFSILFGYKFYPEFSDFTILFITLAMCVAAVFGDLFESLLKRLADVKDSGAILPGHGGLLDRVDALIFASIVLYFVL